MNSLYHSSKSLLFLRTTRRQLPKLKHHYYCQNQISNIQKLVISSFQTSSRGALASGFSEEALRQWAMHQWKSTGVSSGVTNSSNTSTNKTGIISSIVTNKSKVNRMGVSTAASTEGQNEDDYLTDLYSKTLTKECSSWLDNRNNHQQPSVILAKSLFGSANFLPERLLLTPMYYDYSTLPHKFELNDRFLVWTVAVQTPIEIISTWTYPLTTGNSNSSDVDGSKSSRDDNASTSSSLPLVHGCTMLAFDPVIGKVYFGSVIHMPSLSSLVSPPSSSSIMSLSFLKSIMFKCAFRCHAWYSKCLLNGMVRQMEREAALGVKTQK